VLLKWKKRFQVDADKFTPDLFCPGPNMVTITPSIGVALILMFLRVIFLELTKTSFNSFLIIFAVNFILGVMLQAPNYKGLEGGLWIASSTGICYFLAYTVYYLSFFTPDQVYQWMVMFGLKTVILPIETVFLATLSATLLITILKSRIKSKLVQSINFKNDRY